MTPVEIIRGYVRNRWGVGIGARSEQRIDTIIRNVLDDPKLVDTHFSWFAVNQKFEALGYPRLPFPQIYEIGWGYSERTKAVRDLFELCLNQNLLKEVNLDDYL